MRIAFVNSTKKWTGVKTWCLDMGKALQAQGHQVWIFGRPGVLARAITTSATARWPPTLS